MKNALLALAVLLVLVVLSVFAVFLLPSSDRADTSLLPAASPSARTGPSAEASLASAGNPSDGEESAGGPKRSRVEDASAAPAPHWDLASSVWVEGRVALPDRTPQDEEIDILALKEAVDAHELAEWIENRSGALEKVLLSKERAGSRGEFRIPLPPDLEVAHLAVRGRYLYSPKSARIDLKQGERSAVLPASLGAWVRGKVNLPAGVELSEDDAGDIEITLNPDRMRSAGLADFTSLEERETETGPDLTFEFRGVPAGLSCTLQAEPKQFAAAKTLPFATHAGELALIDLSLSPGGAIEGRVLDEAGAAVSGAEIEAVLERNLMFGSEGRSVRRGKSSEDGSFELSAVSPGSVGLRAEREGYLEETETVEIAEGQRVRGVEIVLTRGSRVAGKVLWPDGSAASGAEVALVFDMSRIGTMEVMNMFRGAEGKATTGADGTFEIAGLGSGPFTVRASAPPRAGTAQASAPPLAAATPAAPADPLETADFASPDKDPAKKRDTDLDWKARLDGVAPNSQGLVLQLAEPQGLRGLVRDDAGAPVAKFRIAAASKAEGMIPRLGADTQDGDFSDPDGRFLLGGLTDGQWEVTAIAEGYAVPEAVQVVIPQAPGAEIALVVPRAASVSGRVVETRGSPVADASVSLERTLSNLTQFGRGESPWPEVRTDETGQFTLGQLSPGPASIVASAADFAASEPLAVTLEPGQLVEGVELRLRQGGRLTGEVFDQGKLAPGKSVMVQIPGNIMPRMATTDADGRFEVAHLAPGTYQVIAMGGLSEGPAPGGDTADFGEMMSSWKFTTAEIKEGEDTHVVLGAPPENPVKVHGSVTHSGEPCDGVMISFLADETGGLESMRLDTTDAEGRFEVTLDKPGDYLVTVQTMGTMGASNSVETTETVPKGEEHRLDIALPGGRISGRVYGVDGAPLSGTRVSLVAQGAIKSGTVLGGRYTDVTTDGDGGYRIDWLSEGMYTMAAGGAAMYGLFGGDPSHGRQVRESVKVRDGEWLQNVDFRLRKPASLSGSVRDGAGQAVGEASIFVRTENGRLVESISMMQSDGSGQFTVKGLEPGSYTVSARKGEQSSAESGAVRVAEDAPGEVKLVLEGGTMLLVSLEDGEGKPVQAYVTVLDEAGRQMNGMVSLADLMEGFSKGGFSTSEQRVGPLPPGKYRVIASTSTGESAEKPVVLSGQVERNLKLRLKE